MTQALKNVISNLDLEIGPGLFCKKPIYFYMGVIFFSCSL